jgi:hypothetical protein
MFGMNGQRAIDEWSTGDEFRAEPLAAPEFAAPAGYVFRGPSHVAHAGDAVREEEWEGEVGIPNVHVHVPEAGDEELPACRHDSRTGRGSYVSSDFLDVAGVDEHVKVLARWRASHANDSDMVQEQIGGLGRSERGCEQKCESENARHEEYWTRPERGFVPV